jgi:hypothetical protein
VDPELGIGDQAPAIPHIEGISIDGSKANFAGVGILPPSPHGTTISFVGLSLAVPDRVRYRYKLDGLDHGWSEPIDSRQVVYSNLGPGTYRFHLMAANSDGLWNSSEVSIPFTVEPALWQAWWFRTFSLLVLAFLAWFVYLIRMRQITRQLKLRFDERLSERMRIAQDLHDTLLQGVLSASMQLHVAADRVSEDSAAKPLLKRVIELMGQVTREGRTTLRGLRTTGSEERTLERAFASVPEECVVDPDTTFRFTSEGNSRALHPAVRDEAYRIGREAIVNAILHARAKVIEVLIVYGVNRLTLLVCDDGCGIDAKTLESGKEGHWGLAGMRERAHEIGARLTVKTRPGGGTEVELLVPGSIAYQSQSRRNMLNWLLTKRNSSRRRSDEQH